MKPTNKLTAMQVDKAKAKDKAYKLSDGGGLMLLVNPDGSKWWRLQYRFHGKQKTLSMGVYDTVMLAMARERRDEAKRLLVDGIDPSRHRKSQKAADAIGGQQTFELVAKEWYDSRSKVEKWGEGHCKRVRQMLEKNVYPYIGKTPIAEVNHDDVKDILDRVKKRGALETAHRVRAYMSKIMKYAIVSQRASANPAADFDGYLPTPKKGHFKAVLDPVRVGQILNALESHTGNPSVHYAIRLMPLTIVRTKEMRNARWADFDLDRGLWSFRVTKTNVEHIVPLSRQAIGILREVARFSRANSEYVFPSPRGWDRPLSDGAFNAALRQVGVDKEEMSTHGWRATARTFLEEELGYDEKYTEHQLAHSPKGPLGRAYNRTKHLPVRRRMMQDWADYLDELKAGRIPESRLFTEIQPQRGSAPGPSSGSSPDPTSPI